MTGIVCDLDGVLWRDETPVPGAAEAIERARAAGVELIFVTNNATKSPEEAAAKVRRLCQVPCDAGDMLTSPMAAISILRSEDSPTLVVGERGLADSLTGAGLALTDDPAVARSVVVGMDRRFDYGVLTRAADAIRGGARFIASNADPTYPIETGLIPGAGSLVAAIAVASGVEPEIAGKPHRPMRDLIRSRLPGRVFVIGDRLDSDVAMALAEPDWTSVLVLTGVTGPDADLSTADHVVADLSAAVDLILG